MAAAFVTAELLGECPESTPRAVPLWDVCPALLPWPQNRSGVGANGRSGAGAPLCHCPRFA